jgi:hypothetical protein
MKQTINFFNIKLSVQKKIYKELKALGYLTSHRHSRLSRLQNTNFRILNGKIAGACGVNLSKFLDLN